MSPHHSEAVSHLARQCGELRPEPMQGQKHWELALELDRANTLLSPSLPRLLLCCFTSFPCNLYNKDSQIKFYLIKETRPVLDALGHLISFERDRG